MKRDHFTIARVLAFLATVSLLAFNTAAQTFNTASQMQVAESGGMASNLGMIIMFLAALVGLGGCFYFWRKTRPAIEQPNYNYEGRYKDYYNNNGSYEVKHIDGDHEIELLRKTIRPRTRLKAKPAAGQTGIDGHNVIDTRFFQEKMKKLQYAQLPISSFNRLAPARDHQPLPISNDLDLLAAIEQVHEEYEEDESVRALAVRILAAYRTRNSVDALYQVALYDLSANLRSKAVAVLSDFDHESVFEGILLACADPTREVRAAAARGLFKLNFDRASAWTRLIETGDEFRMRHAVRAAVEAGIVQKSLERLLHDDMKIAYEAFCLVALMIVSGEDREIFKAIRKHKDERVKLALLHVVRVVGDERVLQRLTDIYTEARCSAEVNERIREIIGIFEEVMA